MGSIFGSDSTTKSSSPNNSITASDQALVYEVRGKSGNTKNVTKLGKGATLTVNNGIGEDQFNAGLNSLASSLAAAAAVNPQGPADDSAFKQAVLLSLEKRTEANTTRAVDEVQSASPSSTKKYLWWGVGAVIVVALVIVFGSGKKKK